MKKRDLADNIERKTYFEADTSFSYEQEGTREMGELYPFIISGGQNTERFYFTHINDTTEYKFNIRPQYFCDESNYTEAFPTRIIEILKDNNDAKIFCVFDWDTIYDNETKLKKHEKFEEQFKNEISSGLVVICPNMPSIEYWFLLHFMDYHGLLRNYGKVTNLLGKYMKECFPNPTTKFKKLLKKEEYLKDSTWVENLCSDSKLELAIKRAENNIKSAIKKGSLKNQSYTFVYKLFKKGNEY